MTPLQSSSDGLLSSVMIALEGELIYGAAPGANPESINETTEAGRLCVVLWMAAQAIRGGLRQITHQFVIRKRSVHRSPANAC